MSIRSVFRRFRKQAELKKFYREFISPGELCFDIGANKGEITSVFDRLGARVIAVEPQRKCYEVLKDTFKNNPQVRVLHCALGAEKGTAEFRICDQHDECSSLSEDFMRTYGEISGLTWKQSEKVNLTTLQDLCDSFGIPRFCKTDVEGYEFEVLSGLKTAIPLISFEFNRPLLDNTKKCIELLSKLGNYQFNFFEYEKMNLVLPEWITGNDPENLIGSIIKQECLTGEILARV